MKKIRSINLDEWEKVGEGGNAESYFNRNNDKIMLKLSKGAISNEQDIEAEFRVAKFIDKLNINTPKMIEEVVYDNRKGIIYERLKNKKSFAQLCKENSNKIEYYAKIFAKETVNLHNKKCNIKGLPSHKQMLLDRFNEVRHEDKIIDDIIEFINNEIKDLKYCIHGDLNLGNLVLSEKKLYWIDLGKISYGDPVIELGKTYFSCKILAKIGAVRKLFHLSYNQLNLFYDVFIKEYAKLQKVNYNDLVEKIEKVSVIYYHTIWLFVGLKGIIKSIVKYKAKKYQNQIENKYK